MACCHRDEALKVLRSAVRELSSSDTLSDEVFRYLSSALDEMAPAILNAKRTA